MKPLRIKILHLEYEVLPISSKAVIYEGSNYGLHIPQDNVIYIDAAQSPAEQVRILCHELIHAIWWAHTIPKMARDEEQICGVLEAPLAGLLRDNPKLLERIRAAYDKKEPLVGRE